MWGQPSKKFLPLIITLFLLVILLRIPYIVHEYSDYFLGLEFKRPEELQKPGIFHGKGQFQRISFFQTSFLRRFLGHGTLGVVSDIASHQSSPKSVPDLVLVGQHGAVFLGPDRKIKKRIDFKVSKYDTDRVILVDIEGDGLPEFLNRGTITSAVILFDSNGAVRWRYEPDRGINDAAAGDVDGDGKAEIVVGSGGSLGVVLLNAEGKRLWRREDGNVWDVEMADVDGDSRAEILHSNAGGELTIRNADGEVMLRRRTANRYFSDFSLTKWGEERVPKHLVTSRDGFIYILSLDGKLVKELHAPRGEGAGEVMGTTVYFQDPRVTYATLVNYGHWGRSVLYIHDMEGNLLYQEIFRGNCGALVALREEENEYLLVGCEDNVWKYSSNVTE